MHGSDWSVTHTCTLDLSHAQSRRMNIFGRSWSHVRTSLRRRKMNWLEKRIYHICVRYCVADFSWINGACTRSDHAKIKTIQVLQDSSFGIVCNKIPEKSHWKIGNISGGFWYRIMLDVAPWIQSLIQNPWKKAKWTTRKKKRKNNFFGPWAGPDLHGPTWHTGAHMEAQAQAHFFFPCSCGVGGPWVLSSLASEECGLWMGDAQSDGWAPIAQESNGPCSIQHCFGLDIYGAIWTIGRTMSVLQSNASLEGYIITIWKWFGSLDSW